VTAAIFGLLGVIVGGVLNGLVSARLQRSAQQTDCRAGRRLVRSELVFFLGAATRMAHNRPDELPQLRRASTELWQSNRSILARSLTDEDWDSVARAYGWVDALLSLLVFEADGQLAQWRIDEANRINAPMIESLTNGISALRTGEAGDTDSDDDLFRGGLRPDQMPE
jgi:hypothetical protein